MYQLKLIEVLLIEAKKAQMCIRENSNKIHRLEGSCGFPASYVRTVSI